MKSAREIINIALVVMAIMLAPVSAFAAQVVDINRADAATMIENWKGIGEKKARAIVSYRKSNGPFGSVDDLGNVKGIGDGIIKNNRKYMSVTKGVSKPTGKAASSSKNSAAKDTKKSSTASKKSSSKKASSSDSSKKSTDSKTTSKKSSDKKSSSKKTSKKETSSKKSTNKKSKTTKCKAGSTDKKCKKKAKKSKKKKTT